jgi:hypothetical protein
MLILWVCLCFSVLGRQPLLTLSSIFLMDLLRQEKWQVSVWPALIKYLPVILMAFLHLVCSQSGPCPL